MNNLCLFLEENKIFLLFQFIIMTFFTANCIGNVILKGELVTEDGVERMHFTSVDIDLSVDDIAVKIENIFGGDKALGM